MKTSRSRPKRELSPLQRACVSLGLCADAKPKTNLARLLRKANLGKTAIEYLEFSKGEEARQIVALYYGLNATERKAVTIDYLTCNHAIRNHPIKEAMERRKENEFAQAGRRQC